jgi:hypothetical protein
MTPSIKAAEKATLGRFAKAALIAALLSTLGAAQGFGGAMPDNCNLNLDQCSQRIWGHNSFSHSGVTQSTTFSNGAILTCTSNGRDAPRSCTLSEGHAKAAPAKVRAKSSSSDKAPAKSDSKPSKAF